MRIRKLWALLLLSSASLAFACDGDDSSGGGDGDANSGDGDGDGAPGDGDGNGGDGDSESGDGDGDLGGAPGDDGRLISNPTDAECNLAGVWAVVSKTRASAETPIGTQRTVANRWYLYEISHDGDDVTVVDSVNCQVRVQNDGGVGTTVTISDDALQGILDRNSHAGLKGTYTKAGDSCDLDLARQYYVLGLPDSYLPEDPSARPELDTLPAMPDEGTPGDAQDWDGDEQPGLAFDVATIAGGTRNSVQRGYVEFDSDSTDADYTIALDSNVFRVNNSTEISENVLDAPNDFLKTPGTLDGTDHPVDFMRLGDDRPSAELPSGESLPTSDLALCKALEAEFPFSLD